ncbi:MAG: hypothetical protein M3247_05485 [Thermoproteota archaeon]|jgi:hypothetical protein|nr:hypothetical protein [Thermoproteota archaeon]
MSNRTNKERRERRKEAAFARSGSLGVFILASLLIAGSSFAFIGLTIAPMTTTVVYAQEGDSNAANSTASNTTTTTMTTNATAGIKLSAQPVLQERTTTTSQTPINQTHIIATFRGNGTMTLPGTTETINFTTNGTALISLVTHSTQAKAIIMTEQGETATATFYDILKIDPAMPSDGKGFTMAVINTNSTGTLAPLNGTIVIGISKLQSNQANIVTLWEWESGIDNSANGGVTSVQ